MALWTSQDAAAATGGTASHDFTVSGLSIDTRSIQPGDLFIALKDRRDGHDFVADAFKAGAAAALVERRPQNVPEDAPLLIVPDVLEALCDLARAARARTSAQVVGVTGSVGKTSTKEMLRLVLGRQVRVHAAEKSFNNHWGVPLTLARCPADAEVAVIEIGMNHPGEIAPLAKLADLNAAVITTVAAVHLEAFDNLEGIAREKGDIFTGLRLGGRAIINADLDMSGLLRQMAADAGGEPVLFGIEGAQIRLDEARLIDGHTQLTVALGGNAYSITLATLGRHFAMNALAVMAVVDAFGLDLQQAAQDLGDWQPPPGRGTKETLHLETGTITLLDDAYNANPTSMGAALEVLAATQTGPQGRRVAVLGDMLELGPNEAQMHVDLARHPAFSTVDLAICVGQRIAGLAKAMGQTSRAQPFADAAAAAAALPGLLRDGDVVLVKGSLGSHVSRVVAALREAAKQGT